MDKIKQFLGISEFYSSASYYAQHCAFAMFMNFNLASYEPPKYFLRHFCEEIKDFLIDNNITTTDIIKYFSEISLDDSCYCWVSQCIIKHGAGINDYDEIYSVASGEKQLSSSITIDINILAHAVASFIIDYYPWSCSNFEILVSKERFVYPITDYKLTKINDVTFKKYGMLLNHKYYLYSRYINKNPIIVNDEIPGVFKLLIEKTDFTHADFYMRLDEQLAIPESEIDGQKELIHAKFYGPNFKFSTTKLQHAKTFTIHYNPETGNKLLMVIKKDSEDNLGKRFWHVELEELPYKEKNESDARVTTTFIHGKYYPDDKIFRHIDFTKNQYSLRDYCDKYDARSNSDVSIDFYTTKDCHYKIWCIENIDISEKVWYEIASLSLSQEYRTLFDEMLDSM